MQPKAHSVLQHLNPQNEFMFQHQKKNMMADSDVWYDNMVVSERYLGDMIKKRIQTGLSKQYTNHSIRSQS
jgi:hypothetical protein